MSDLRKELEAAGLAEYVEPLEKQRVDLQVLAGLTEADLGKLCGGWPFGDQVRLRSLCKKLGAQSAVTAGRESAASIRPPASSGPAHGVEAVGVPKPSIEFDRDLIDNLPMVIARPLDGLLAASEAMIVVRRADLLLENTIRFLGLVCQADYYSHPNWFDGAINVAIDKKLRRPTLGHWIEFVRECLQSANRARLEPFLLELPESWGRLAYERRHTQSSQIYDDVGELVRRDGKLTTLDWLSAARNAYAHAKRSPEDPQAAAGYREMACKFVDELRWIRQYELWAVDRTTSLRLRGLQPSAEKGGPRIAATAGWSIALRRRSIQARGGSQQLELPPLIVPELNLRKDAKAGEAALYHSEGPNNTLSYTPTELNADAIQTPRTAEEYRRARGKKQFRKLSRDQLTAEELRLRIDTATSRSLEILKETAKYRPHLHFVRSRCEPQIEAWIRSSKPLLGIEARAGAGKTGILASLVHKSWAALAERPPILFLLARDFESSSLERVLRTALVLDEDVSLDLVSDCLGVPPVFVIDGLNEHKLREDLLEGIVREAERTMRSGKGPRFAISWRSEDRAWVSRKLRQRDLWWDGYSARSSIPQSSKDFNRSGGSVERSGLEPKPGDGGDANSSPRQDSSLEPKSNLIGASPSLREPDPCFIVPRLSDDELAQMWELYRDGDRDKCRPRFSFEQLRSKSSAFANDLRNPLDMRIALEMYNDREIGEVRQGSLYAEYLGTLRDRSSDCDQLLKLLSELLAEGLEASVHEYAITQRRASLVYTNGPISALDFLERVGVVTIWTEGNQKLVRFTNERIAEQAIGEYLAANPDGPDPTPLAKWVAEANQAGLVLANGAARVALSILVEQHGLQYLTGFIDEQPPAVEAIAGRVLANLIERSGQFESERIATELVANQTDADFAVALEAAETLWRDEVIELEHSFLLSLREAALSASARSEAARKLCFEFESVLTHLWSERFDEVANDSSQNKVEHPDEWRVRLSDRWRDIELWDPLAQILNRRARRLADERAYEAALSSVQQALDAAMRSNSRQRIASAYDILGDVLSELDRHEEAVANYELAISAAKSPSVLDGWHLVGTLLSLGRSQSTLARHDEALLAVHEATELASGAGDPLEESYVHSVRAGLFIAAERFDDALESSRYSIDVARRSGDRRVLALALEWNGDTLRKLDRHAEAIALYEEAVATGTKPTRVADWTEASPWIWLAQCHNALGCPDESIRCELEALRDLGSRDAHADCAYVAARIGRLNHEAGRPEDALEWGRKAVNFARRSGDRRVLALALEWNGDTLRKLDRHEEAIALYEEAVATGTKPTRVADWTEASPWLEMAKCHKALGCPDESIRCELEALRDFGSRDAHDDCAYAAARIGDRHLEAERAEAALEWKRKAVDFARRSGDRRVLALALEWNGDTLRKLDRHEEAIGLYEEAVEAGTKPTRVDEWDEASPWMEMAKCRKALGDSDGSIRCELEALRCFESREGFRDCACVADRISDCHLEAGRSDSALEWSRRSVDFARRSGDRRALAIAFEWHGDTLRELNRHEEAIEQYEAAVEAGTKPTRVEDFSEEIVRSRAAHCQLMLGNYEDALPPVSRCLKVDRERFMEQPTDETRNRVVWSAHLTASCLLGLNRADEARTVLNEYSEAAEELERTCGDDLNCLDTCAAYWETGAKLAEAFGEHRSGTTQASRAAGIRARIATLKGGGA